MSEVDSTGAYVRKEISAIVENARLTFVRQLGATGTYSKKAEDAFNNAMQTVVSEIDSDREHGDDALVKCAAVVRHFNERENERTLRPMLSSAQTGWICSVSNGLNKVQVEVLASSEVEAHQKALHCARQCSIFQSSDKLTIG